MDADYLDIILQFDFQENTFNIPVIQSFKVEKYDDSCPRIIPIKVLHPPDRATELARLQAYSL